MTISEPPAAPEPTTTNRPDRSEQPDPASRRILYTPAEAATLLAVKESWLRRQAGQRTIASTMLGKHLRFSDRSSPSMPDESSMYINAVVTRSTARRARAGTSCQHSLSISAPHAATTSLAS